MGRQGVPIEVKRLRFDGYPDLLGAGTNLDLETAKKFEDKTVRIFEGVVASGSTEAVIIAAILNWGVRPAMVDCDAVIICPVGAKFASEFRAAVKIAGLDKCVYSVGTLNEDWYLIWYRNDRIDEESSLPGLLVGEQVLGDGGDLTSI